MMKEFKTERSAIPSRTAGRDFLSRFAIAGIVISVAATGSLAAEEPHAITIKPVVQQELPNAPGNQLTSVVVDLAPGAKLPSHHHAGFVFAYVLSGTVRSQLNKGNIIDYHAGQSWVEPPGTEHTLFEDPSPTAPASLLAIFVAPSKAELTTFDK